VRALIADDSVLVREGIARLLERSDIDVVAQAGDFDDLLRKARAHKPEVAVVDIRMPPDHSDEGIRAAHAIRRELPGTGVLVLSQHLEAAYALELLNDGSDGLGYLLKDRVTEGDAFVDAVRRVAGGGSALDPQVVQELLGRRREDDPLDRLTPRERDVLTLMAEGLTNSGIAARLVVTEKAVERHVTAIFSKLLLDATSADHRRVLAVLKFLEA
jgi:DNA-binding NarL/FixJ family response regulator